MEIRELRESEQEECLDLWAAAFPRTGRDYFIKYFRGDVNWRPGDTIVCEEDGRLVSAVSIVRRNVSRGALRMSMAGIANVGTLPEARGKGHSTACLRRAIAYMEAEDFDFSLLGTGIPDYYARLGWIRTPLPAYQATIPTDAPRSDEGARSVTAADLPAVAALYSVCNAGRPLAVERPEGYWKGWLQVHADAIPDNLLLAETDGKATGYLRFDLSEVALSIRELAVTNAETERRLLAAALARAGERKTIYANAFLSPESWALFADRREAFSEGWMSRLTVPLRLVGKIAALSGWETARAAALLNAQTREKFFAYLYGTAEPETEELRTLFPPVTTVWYPGDGF